MPNKPHLPAKSRKRTSRNAPSVPKTLEQQAGDNPVVQEVMRVFDARISSIVPTDTWEENHRRSILSILSFSLTDRKAEFGRPTS